jgi:hypothetical protein
MAERMRNRSVVFTDASAEATVDSKGNRTVTVRGHFTEDGYSQTNTLHLSEDAAQALFQQLDMTLP